MAKMVAELLNRLVGNYQEIVEDVSVLNTHRYVFKETIKAVKANPGVSSDNHFFDMFDWAFWDMCCMEVRRQTDNDKSFHSVAGVLDALRTNHSHITRTRWIRFQQERDASLQEPELRSWFREYANSTDPEHIDEERLNEDFSTLISTCKPVREFATARLAHRKRSYREQTQGVDDETIDRAVDEVFRVTKKYCNLLLCFDGPDLTEPTFAYDWQESLRVPWLGR